MGQMASICAGVTFLFYKMHRFRIKVILFSTQSVNKLISMKCRMQDRSAKGGERGGKEGKERRKKDEREE